MDEQDYYGGLNGRMDPPRLSDPLSCDATLRSMGGHWSTPDQPRLWPIWLRSIQLLPRRARWRLATTLFKADATTQVVLRLRSGVVMRLDVSDKDQRAMAAGAFEYDTLEVSTSILREGDWVVDVGANIGLHALTWARAVGPRGRVLAFEPAPPNYEALTQNVGLNPSTMRVEMFNCALGEAEGELLISTSNMRGGRTFGGYSATHGADEGFRVALKTLDAVLGGMEIGGPLRLIKMDVEGWESRVITGAMETIRRHRPYLLVEWNPNYRCEELYDVIWTQLVEGLGYRPTEIVRTRLAGRGRAAELNGSGEWQARMFNLMLLPPNRGTS